MYIQWMCLSSQYCMPFARHLLASLEVGAVTQARASDDYKPGDDQWAIGGQAVLFDALGERVSGGVE
jgi:hypothetical protein